MSNVKILRLANDAYVIGDVTPPRQSLAEQFGAPSDGDLLGRDLEISNAAQIVFGPDPTTQRMSVSLMPFMFFTDDQTITIAAHHIIAVVSPESQLLNAYNQQFGSGLVLPPKGSLGL